jgi:hypothetical protein
MSRPFNDQEGTLKANLEELQKIKESEHLNASEKKQNIAKNLPKTHGRWNDIQNIAIDVEVGYRVKILAGTESKLPSINEMISHVEEEVKLRYREFPEQVEILLTALPAKSTYSRWVKKPEWSEEVEKRLKDQNLFSLDKRAAMIESLYKKGITGDNKSAEMWLKMSGDLTNQPPTKDKALDSFKQLSESLFNAKE